MKPRLLLLLVTFVFSTPAFGESPDEWMRDGRHTLENASSVRPIKRRAKNVILFVGDGMGVSTVTSARILEGQLRGQPGEENMLSFENLPHVSLSKTYNTNQQVADSAGTMTAMMSGVKTLAGVLGVDQTVKRGDCESIKSASRATLLEEAETAGMATGVISTARITHATPAAAYGHSSERNWETDAFMSVEALEAGCKDLAVQLLEFDTGDGLELAWGGGRSMFTPEDAADIEDTEKTGFRKDGRDLTQEWEKKYGEGTYIWNREQFDTLDPSKANHVLGLFDRSHMKYEHDRKGDPAGEPSLSEMTSKAIDVLEARSKHGYLLVVESGRIDHGHHAGNAYRALTDTIEMSKAVAVAMQKTWEKDTLIVVTADHSHTLTIVGYPTRGNPILGKVVTNDEHGVAKTEAEPDLLGLPYLTLHYANGPGYVGKTSAQDAGPKTYPHWAESAEPGTSRPDMSAMDTTDPNFLQETHIFNPSETHGGEDVAIYARGPSAYLFHGVHEQHYIYHVMRRSLRMEKRLKRQPR